MRVKKINSMEEAKNTLKWTCRRSAGSLFFKMMVELILDLEKKFNVKFDIFYKKEIKKKFI